MSCWICSYRCEFYLAMGPVIDVAPVDSGTVAKVAVKTHQLVADGVLLFQLDKRPFEFALKQAQSGFDIAEVSYLRVKTAIEKKANTFIRQRLDEERSQFDNASAAPDTAKHNVDRTDIVSVGDGVLCAVELLVGDHTSAFKHVMGLFRTGEVRIWRVFQQNGWRAKKVGSDVAIAMLNQPGKVYWSKIVEIAPGTGGGQANLASRITSQGDIGSSGEMLVVIEWPRDLPKDALQLGSIGTATVIGTDAGAVGSLASILIQVKSWANYL